MLSKDKRLNLKKDFKWAVSGKRAETKHLRLFYKSGDNQTARVGIAVSAKVFDKAVKRNRARRIVSAAFEKLCVKLPDNINIMALPKATVIEVKSGEVLLELEQGLKKAGVISGDL